MAVRVPVDTGRVTLIAGGSGSPVVKNRATGELAVDNQTKQTLYAVNLSVFVPGDDVPQVWRVKVAGEPAGLSQGQAVRVAGLVASDWEMEEQGSKRHGISFRAESIAPAEAAAAPAPPARVASSKGAAA